MDPEELSPLEDMPPPFEDIPPLFEDIQPLEDMPHLESETPTARHGRRRVQVPGEESDNSMPDLQSVSNSSGSEYASDDSESESGNDNDDAMQAVDDDNDLAWTDDDQDSQMPPLEPLEPLTTRGNRRARVQDDLDGERDRRHPSQRGANLGGTRIHTHTHTVQIAAVSGLNGGAPVLMAIDPDGTRHPINPDGPHAIPIFANIFARMGGQFTNEPEVPDPERAKRLVDALEQVPIGLVRRLERVGDVGGGDDSGAGGDSACAICWDTLLDSEGVGFGVETKEEASPLEVEPPKSRTSSPPEQPKIVALPCAHVFHASCLIPWFSRPRHTTCPTCRFDVDPENLTYIRRPPPTVDAEENAQPAPPAENEAAPDLLDEPTELPTNGTMDDAINMLFSAFAAATPAEGDESDDEEEPTQFQGGMFGFPMPIFPVQQPAAQQTPADEANHNGMAAIQAQFAAAGFPPPGPHIQGLTGAARAALGLPPPSNLLGTPARNSNETPAHNTDAVNTNTANPNPPANNAAPNAIEANMRAEMLLTFGNGGATPTTPAIFSQVSEGIFRNFRSNPGAAPPVATAATQPQRTEPAVRPPRPMPQPAAQPAPAQPTQPRADFFRQQFQDLMQNLPPIMMGQTMFDRENLSHHGTPREKKTWVLPSAPGLSLRQRIERKEREAGLRCDDMSCGVGPSDEDPLSGVPENDNVRLCIFSRSHGTATDESSSEFPCLHLHHRSCLVTAERVALKGAEPAIVGDFVHASCGVCRADGCVSKADWDAGVHALIDS